MVLNKYEAIQVRAIENTVDDQNVNRKKNEKWLIRGEISYMPQAYEEVASDILKPFVTSP